MAEVVKRLRPRIVVPICVGSNPIFRPIIKVPFGTFLVDRGSMSRLSERIENFNRAFKIYNDAVLAYRNDKQNQLMHMALVQTFKITYELSWKILKDYLKSKGIIANYPKEVIKEAFATETIKDGQTWIDMLETRNSTSHEYNMDKIDKKLEDIAYKYFDELTLFAENLKDFND